MDTWREGTKGKEHFSHPTKTSSTLSVANSRKTKPGMQTPDEPALRRLPLGTLSQLQGSPLPYFLSTCSGLALSDTTQRRLAYAVHPRVSATAVRTSPTQNCRASGGCLLKTGARSLQRKKSRLHHTADGSGVKNPPANAGDVDSVPSPGRSQLLRDRAARVPATITEPVLQSPGATATELTGRRAWAPQ